MAPGDKRLAKKKDPPGLPTRLAAAERLDSVLKGANFAPFSVSEIADGRDRAIANRLVTTALRRHGQLNLVIARYLDRGVPKRSGPFEALLRLSLAQLLYLPEMGDHSALFLAVEATRRDNRSQHLGKLMNAVLRRAQADRDELLALPETALFPDRLVTLWQGAYGADAMPGLAAALLDGAPLDLTLRDEAPELVSSLGAAPVAFDTVRIADRDRPVEALPGYAEGSWWVQDAAAALPARLLGLPAGSAVLDLCAAPGGKTAQLAKAGYKVTALDIDPLRMERVTENLQRLGYAAELLVGDGTALDPARRYDGILLDAPCSATGTFRRHPEVVWHRDAADIAGRVALQRRFISAAAACLNPGGVLVYCVCSLEPAEGEEQARWAAETVETLVADPIQPAELGSLAFAALPSGVIRTYPGQAVPGENGGTLDGFFVARFRRR